MRVFVCLCLPLLSILSSANASSPMGLDICHSEPQVEVHKSSTSNPSLCTGGETILIQFKFHPNPNHSLHDTAWAVVHYLRNCLSPPYWPSKWSLKHVFLTMEVPFFAELSLCGIEPDEDEYDRWKRPLWGPCLMRAVGLDMGIPAENIFAGPNFNSTRCFRNTVTLRERYRPLQYRVAPYNNNSSETHPAQTVPEWVKRDVFNNMAQAPFRTYLRGDRKWSRTWSQIQRPRRHVNVLVYDRMDRRPHKLKRKWHSPQRLVERLRQVQGLVVDHRSELPKALPSQAKLFRWADVVLAPHGAAMANTLFMQQGAQVVEITKCCDKEVRLNPESRRDWTGWHADFVPLNLRYVQCHPINGTLSVEELATVVKRDPPVAETWCSFPFFRVDDDEVFATMQTVLPGQFRRVGRDDLRTLFGGGYTSNYDLLSTLSIPTLSIVVCAWGFHRKRREQRGKFRKK